MDMLCVLRRYRSGDKLPFLLFPEWPADNYGRYCMSYQHIGQHSGADYRGCIRDSKPADISEPDVAELVAEWLALGDNQDDTVRIIKRYTVPR